MKRATTASSTWRSMASECLLPSTNSNGGTHDLDGRDHRLASTINSANRQAVESRMAGIDYVRRKKSPCAIRRAISRRIFIKNGGARSRAPALPSDGKRRINANCHS